MNNTTNRAPDILTEAFWRIANSKCLDINTKIKTALNEILKEHISPQEYTLSSELIKAVIKRAKDNNSQWCLNEEIEKSLALNKTLIK